MLDNLGDALRADLAPTRISGVRFSGPLPYLARISGENDGFIAHLTGLDFLTRYQVRSGGA